MTLSFFFFLSFKGLLSHFVDAGLFPEPVKLYNDWEEPTGCFQVSGGRAACCIMILWQPTDTVPRCEPFPTVIWEATWTLIQWSDRGGSRLVSLLCTDLISNTEGEEKSRSVWKWEGTSNQLWVQHFGLDWKWSSRQSDSFNCGFHFDWITKWSLHLCPPSTLQQCFPWNLFEHSSLIKAKEGVHRQLLTGPHKSVLVSGPFCTLTSGPGRQRVM